MNPGLGNSGTIPLSGLHFGVAMVFLALGAVGLAWVAPDLAAGRFLEPRVAAVTHLFTLGWLTTTILGALYQLLPVALGAPLRSVPAGYASLALFAPGLALFVAGVATGHDPMRHAGLAFVIPALLLAIANVGVSMHGAPTRDVTWWSIAVALVSLLATMALGALLVHNLKTGVLAASRVRVLAVHIHLALGGWAFAVVIGISRRLLPMFLLAHGVDDRWSGRALGLLAAGIVTFSSGLLGDRAMVAWAGAGLLVAAVAAFLLQVRRFLAARVRRRLDAGLRIARAGVVLLGAAGVAGIATLALGPRVPRVATAYGILAVLAVVLYVTGHFYKIVPFLAWIAHYRGRMGREQVPAIADLYSGRLARVQGIVMTLSVVALVVGTLAGHAHCVRAGALLLATGVAVFAIQIAGLLRPRRVLGA